jgi:outer membrane receptor for ferrienterochelin and colicins
MKNNFVILFFIFIFLSGWAIYESPLLFAQTASISGRLVDRDSSPVAGANISLKGTVLGTASNEDGVFRIVNVPAGEFHLIITVIGYKQEVITVQAAAAQQTDLATITLTEVALSTEPILVTAGRYEQKLQDIPASVGTVSRQEIQNRNTITIDKALQYVPGLNLNQSQLNIRGSTGYSRGVGSRVIMLVDGMPYLTGDTQEMIFSAIQMNQIERIEIVKGAGSALYGSSAMGGVVNIITKDISSEPQGNLKFYGGLYSEPYYPQWKWTEQRKYMKGLSLNYSAKTGMLGYMLAASTDQDDSYKQNDWYKRYQAGGKLQFTLSPYRRLVIGGNYMTQKRGNFLYWQDLAHALIPPESQVDDRVKSTRYHLNAVYQHVLDNQKFYTARVIWFNNHFDDTIEGAAGQQGNKSTSDFLNGEFQFNWQHNIQQWIGGISLTYNRVKANLFGDQSGRGAACFVQDEVKWNPGFSTTAGLRFDYFDVDSLRMEYKFNPKFGLVYKPWPGTALRSSLGSSFRAPSIAEAFTSTSAGGLRVIPNLNLDPEQSWSAELGLNQFLGQHLFFDLALFYSRIWDLIEGKFVESGDVQFTNITDARIIGGEIVFNWEVIKDWFSWRSGYTYCDPWDLSQQKYLTYRPRHIFYNNATVQYHRIQFNIDYRFLSRYDQIDATFALIIPDAEERVPVHIVDLRLLVPFTLAGMNLESSLQINNIFQYNYVDLIGSIASPRNFILTMNISF